MGVDGVSPTGALPKKNPSFPSRERHKAVRRKLRTRSQVDADSIKTAKEQQHALSDGGEYITPKNGTKEKDKKTCNSCKCPREAHDVYHEEWVNVRDRLGFKTPSEPDRRTSRERSLSEGYSWVPPGLSSEKIDEYFQHLPTPKVPQLGTQGEKYRDKQMMLQLPKQDLALAYCKHVEAQHHASYEDFINARNEIALDIAYVKDNSTYTAECPQCHRMISPGEVAVVAPKFGDRVMWHPACFVCSTCEELLVDLTYCVHDDQLYCERHYAEQLKPRCAACDEIDHETTTSKE